MNRLCLSAATLLAFVFPAVAQPEIRYELAWERAAEHYFEVTIRIGNADGDQVDVSIPAWRPGRYVMQNYARNVLGFEARTEAGEKLPFQKIDRDTWRIETSGQEAILASYQVYAAELDGGQSYVDEREAYLNPISVLMYVDGRLTEPVALTLRRPDGWRVASPLVFDEQAGAWIAEDYHELVDTPFLVSPDFDLLQFDFEGVPIEIAIQGDLEYDEARLVADHRAILRAQIAIMGSVPFDRYLFLYHFPDSPMGHGVEHKNSTAIVLGPASAFSVPAPGEAISRLYRTFLAVASHELFHAWLVERIRPAAMVPTDYSTEQYTRQMWIYEGITDYYADVALRRAGLIDSESFLSGLASTVKEYDQDPARKITSVAMSSFDSWVKQDDAPPGTFYSFYTAGKALGLVLDLEVRHRTGGEKSLDDVLRLLYDRYYLHDLGVPENGFQLALEEVAGNSFEDFFQRHVSGTDDVPWNDYLRHAGLRAVRGVENDPAAWLQVYFGGVTALGVHPAGAAGQAGLRAGDVFSKVGDTEITEYPSLVEAFSSYAPGDSVAVTVQREGAAQGLLVTVGAPPPTLSFEALETTSETQQALRDAWLKAGE